MSDELAKHLVRAALEHRKETSGLSWKALAEKLEIDEVTIHRWRDGELGRASRVLVQLVAEACSANAV